MMKKLAPILILALAFQACSEDKSNQQNPIVAQSFNELTVPKDFNWSSSDQVQMEVELKESSLFPMDLQGTKLEIRNELGDRLALATIDHYNRAHFSVLIPDNSNGFYFHLNATGQSWPLELKKNVVLQLSDPLDQIASTSNKVLGKQAFTGTPPGTNMLGNGGFQQTVAYKNVGYSFDPTSGTADDQKWYVTDNEFSQPQQNGSKVFKVDNNRWTHLWQIHTVQPGDSIHFSADYHGYVRAYLFFYSNANSSYAQSSTSKVLSSNDKVISSVVPNNSTVVVALFNLYDNAWIDNAFLSNPAAITDTDNDGVADGDDDFPNDPTRAYLSYYPTVGRQTIAYEDMWPLKGDYDFNDMVINVKSSLVKNGDDEWVSAEYEIALDAFGGGIESGLALRLTNSAKNSMSSIISSVSGNASLDPDVSNGIILFSDPDQVRSQYYNNTEAGRMADPDTIRFTINFVANNNGADFLNDFYIFHKNQRGREIHLSGFSGTNAADANLYNTGDDVNGTYKTTTGLPWAMDIVLDGDNFRHPMEKVDMITAYPSFSLWAGSAGAQNSDWFQTPNLSDIIDLGGL